MLSRFAQRRGPGAAAVAVFMLAGSSAVWGQPASFRGLGQLSGYAYGTKASGISADGAIIVGTAQGIDTSNPPYSQISEGFRWQAGVLLGLGRDAGTQGTATTGVSGDGRVIIGHRWGTAGIIYGVRWESGVRSDLVPGGPQGWYPRSVSYDGSVIGGPDGYIFRAGTWTNANVSVCGSQESVTIAALSGDGAQALAARQVSLPPLILLPDTSALAIVPLRCNTGPLCMTRDATAVASESSLWQRGTSGATWIYPLDGPSGISDDGTVVVGGQSRAQVWTSRSGARNVDCVLAQLGLDLTGWTLTSAVGVSADGRTIAGNGTNPQGRYEAWTAYIPEVPRSADYNGDRFIDGIDYDTFVNDYEAGAITADFNVDGFVDGIDYDLFMIAFNIGC